MMKEGKYRIKSLDAIELELFTNDEPESVADVRKLKCGEVFEVEIIDIDEQRGTATFYWAATTPDEIDIFSADVRGEWFEILQKQVIAWEDV
jgi:hypothetical protein